MFNLKLIMVGTNMDGTPMIGENGSQIQADIFVAENFGEVISMSKMFRLDTPQDLLFSAFMNMSEKDFLSIISDMDNDDSPVKIQQENLDTIMNAFREEKARIMKMREMKVQTINGPEDLMSLLTGMGIPVSEPPMMETPMDSGEDSPAAVLQTEEYSDDENDPSASEFPQIG